MSDDVTSASSGTPDGEPTLAADASLSAAPRPGPTSPSGAALLQLGRYRILRVIGEGGMGTVYEAEQDKPRRTVALKVIKPGFATASLLRRFEQESQVLGRLQHPGIAQIYDAGTADAGHGLQPYFAMELVRGQMLDEHAARQKLNLRQRLELVARICDAVEHAHQKGIVHRDLKPGNILIDESGQPKILDFGVARATDSDVQATMQTEIGAIVGTLPYMSPEQVGADPTELDTRSDVYALGVILYELLAGRLPYDLKQKSLPEVARIIREQDPSRLSSVSRTLRGDVETIAAKALSKERERRYQSAAELAADIRRYLKDEPIVARPASTAYQLRKFARRNKALVGGMAAVFVVLAIGVVVSLFQALRATRAEKLATSSLADTQAAQTLAESRQRESEQARRLAEERRTEAEAQKAAAEQARESEAEQRRAAEASAERAKQETAKAEAVNRFLQDMLSSADPTQMKGRDVTVRQVLDEAAKKVGAGSLASQPEVDAAVRTTLGTTYETLGLYPEAEPHLRAALEIRKRSPGAGQVDLASSLNGLAVVLEDRGDLAGAEPLLREALAIRRKALGDEHESVATSLNNLANLLKARRDLAGAEPLYRESLAIYRKVLGDEDPSVAASLNNLAALLKSRRDLAGAEPLYRESLAIRRKALGDEHPSVATSLNNLAMLLKARGDLAGAEPLIRESLVILRKELGDEHPDVARSLDNLAGVLRDRGDLAGAEPLYRESLAIRRKALGDEHPDVADSLDDLARLLKARGDLAGAEALSRQALAIWKKVLPARDPEIASGMANLGDCLIRQGRYADAEPLLTEALSIREEKLPGHWRRFDTRSMLGEALAGQKKFVEAEPLLLQGYEGMKDSAAAEAILKRDALERIVHLYESWGKPDKAAAWRVALE